MNKTRILVGEEDIRDLKAEVTETKMRDLLIQSHDLSRRVFTNSNIQVHKIVALQITLQKLPYQYH